MTQDLDRPPLFGEIAVKWGYCARGDVDDCLRTQEQMGGLPLGEIMVERGLLSDEQVNAILREQLRWYQKSGDKVFGRVVVTLGWATDEEVQDAIREQRDKAEEGLIVRLGEILVDRGILTPQNVATILDMQKRVEDKIAPVEPKPAAPEPQSPT